MDNKINTFDRRNFYNDGDSGKVFLFALILPILLSLIFSLIANLIAGVNEIESSEVTNNIWFTAVYGVVSGLSYITLYLVYNKINKIDYKAINLKFKMKWHTYLIIIGIGLLSLFGILYFIGSIDDLLRLIGFPLESSTAESLTNPQSIGIFILSIFVTCLVPAICEELLFRGIILNGLRTRYNDYCAIFMSAFMFALMHQNLQQLVYPFLLGSIMAWLVLRTGSLVSSIIVHFINNFLVIFFTYLQNIAGFSIVPNHEWWYYIMAICLLAITIGIIFLIDHFYFKNKSKENITKSSEKPSKYIYISIGVALVLMLFITIYTFASV